MPDSPEILADRLVQEGGRVVDFFKGLMPQQWAMLVYPDQSNWNFHDLLAHFVSAEIGRRELIMNVCSGGMGVSEDFSIDAFNQKEVERYSSLTNEELILRFVIERKELAHTISSLSTSDLEKVGNDPFLGRVPLADMVKLTYRHLQIHLREVRRIIE